jgi:Glycosyltransferase family 87
VRGETALAAAALGAIVTCSVLLVVMGANRPSLLVPTSRTGFFPGWMAGPLGGLWPSLTRDPTTLRYLFTGAMALMYGSYLLALAYVPSRLGARWAIGAIVASHAILLLAPPLSLTDVFNYINYGRMEVVHHLNPYTTYPMLEPHSDPAFALSNWHQLLSPYGPLFTLLTFALVPLGVAGSLWAIKATLCAASLALIALVWLCARRLGRDPVAAIVLVGLNPIVLVWGLGGDHNDFLMMLFIVLGFLLLLVARGRPARAGEGSSPMPAGPGVRAWLRSPPAAELGAGAAFVTAVAFKASAAILIPIVLAGLLRAPRRLARVVGGMLAAAVVLGAASLIAFGPHIPDFSTQSRLVTSVSVPNLIGLALGAGGETQTLHTILTGLFACALLACCVHAWRRRDALAAAGWASVALLVTLSWVLPWYVMWVLPLAALAGSRRLRTATLVLGVYLIVAWAPATGLLWSAIGFHPEKTSLGRLHQRYVRELLN